MWSPTWRRSSSSGPAGASPRVTNRQPATNQNRMTEDKGMNHKEMSGSVTRRHALVLTGAAAAAATIGLLPSIAAADKAAADKAINEDFGGKSAQAGKITLDLPQIAENGNTVPIGLEVESPMSATNYVKRVSIYAEANPNPRVATLYFTPACGAAKASTRMRLLKTQNIIAIAEMSDGSVYSETVEVKVTIGGCGG